MIELEAISSTQFICGLQLSDELFDGSSNFQVRIINNSGVIWETQNDAMQKACEFINYSLVRHHITTDYVAFNTYTEGTIIKSLTFQAHID